jgi:hypothetical protein
VLQQREEGGADWYSLQPDGSLACLQDPPIQLGGTWVPCCVVFATKGGPRKEQRQQAQQQDSAYYLVGAWEDVQVDPSVWGFGEAGGVLRYTVKAATQRLLQLQCSSLPGWVPGYGVRPRLLEGPGGSPGPSHSRAGSGGPAQAQVCRAAAAGLQVQQPGPVQPGGTGSSSARQLDGPQPSEAAPTPAAPQRRQQRHPSQHGDSSSCSCR